MKRLLTIMFIISVLLAGCEQYDPTETGLLVPKTVDEDPAIPSISVNGTQLHSESFGNAGNPMIVVIHGGPGGDYRYLLNCQEFADYGYYVIFYDQRGSGLSKRESKSSYSLQIMLDDLSAVIEHYRTSPGQKIIFLGHSWGAMMATAFINQYPNAVDGLILGEPGGFVWEDIKGYVSRIRDFGFTTEISNDATYLDQFIAGKETQHEKLDYKMSLTTSSDGSRDNPVGNEDSCPFWRSGAVVNMAMFEIGEQDKPDWTGNLNAFHAKVLFVYSERNRAYGLEYAQHVSSAYPNVQLERIDRAGHDMLTFPAGWNNFLPFALNYLNEIK